MAAHIYLSPHLDDAVLSCGGLMARQAAAGESVLVVTVCAGDPGQAPLSNLARSLHERWGESQSPVGDRRSEDRVACGRLDASVHHLDIPDAIYRVGASGVALYPTEESLMAPLSPHEADLISKVADRLRSVCPAASRLYSPLAIGGHVDHRLTRAAAESLGRPLWYYRDFPYASRQPSYQAELPPPPGRETSQALSSEEIQAWAAAVLEYRSQLSTFWPDDYALYQEIREFHDRAGGVVLLSPRDVSQAA